MVILVRGGWVVWHLLKNPLKPAENMPEIRFEALEIHFKTLVLRLESVVSLGVV